MRKACGDVGCWLVCWVWLQVEASDMDRVSKATGARVQTTVNDLTPSVLGSCSHFEERQVRHAGQLLALRER